MASLPFNSVTPAVCAGRRMFVRADLNVPLEQGAIADDTRLRAVLPTLDLVLNAGGDIVLATHLGRPDATQHHISGNDPLSTHVIAAWFQDHGYDITLQPDLKKAVLRDGTPITLLENLRFYKGERTTNSAFALLLAATADAYINDAFGVMHRNDTSVTLLAKEFPHHRRYIGPLVEREFLSLNRLKKPPQPFHVILGGNKVIEKLPFITALIALPRDQRPTTIMVGGLLSLPLSVAAHPTPSFDSTTQPYIDQAQSILAKAMQSDVRLLIPIDYSVERAGAVYHVSPSEVVHDDVIIDCGPATIQHYTQQLAHAHTIFMNGPMGIYERGDTAPGTTLILQELAQTPAFTVIGGGSTIAAANIAGITNTVKHVSTGGGATLAFLAARNPFEQLPGCAALKE